MSNTAQHLSSYPFVSQSVSHVRKNPYTAKSFAIADEVHANYAKPVINSPYLKRFGPYLAKVDSLGNEGLKQVDSRFPYLREDPETLMGYISTPLRVAEDRKKHLLDVYSSQCTRSGGEGAGYTARGKALFTTGLKVTSEGLEWLSDYLVPEPLQTGQNGQAVAGATPAAIVDADDKSYADAAKE